MSLIQNLPPDQLDIIGDIHGQFEAFQNLLHYLGYQADGYHPQGRKIVLVGDLIDRGPNSPAVLQWFEQAYQHHYAWMVLGNHELNLLNHEAKEGSGWFFACRQQQDTKNYGPWTTLKSADRQKVIDLLKQQPIVLQRADLRVVHAAWLPESIAQLRLRVDEDVQILCQDWDQELNHAIQHTAWFDSYLAEQHTYASYLENIHFAPPMLWATATHDVYRSTHHPIRALTCGIEKIAREPFFASGRWRFSIRYPWWNDYWDKTAVVIGHYWRQWINRHVAKYRIGMFNVPAHHWHGYDRNVFCIDFSVGARWQERKKNIAASQSNYRLAALRWPEKSLVLDNGEMIQTVD